MFARLLWWVLRKFGRDLAENFSQLSVHDVSNTQLQKYYRT